MLAVSFVLASEISIIYFANKLGHLLRIPIVAGGRDNSLLMRKLTMAGNGATFMSAQIVGEVIRQQREGPAEILSVFFVEKQKTPFASSDGDGYIHKSESNGIIVVPVGGRKGDRH